MQEEGWLGALDARTGDVTLFMPRLPQAYAVWMGEIRGPEFYRRKYAVAAVHYVDELPQARARALNFLLFCFYF